MNARPTEKAAVICACLALQGCASAPPEQAEVALYLHGQGSVCRATLEGREYVLPGDQDGLEAKFRSLAARGTQVVLVPGPENVSYRCMGGLIFLAQKNDVRIGFVSEPPP